MAQTLVKTIADFNTTLASAVAVGATTATLTSATDDDGVALPTGTYVLTVDRKNSSKEFFECTLTGTALTSIKTLARGTAVGTSGFARAHRKGAEVIISDFAAIKRITNVLDGTTNFDSATPLGYDGAPTISSDNQFATKKYADDLAIAGSPDASTTTKGIVEEATQAEVDAGTAAGGTSARLFQNPSTIRAKLYHDYAADAGSNDTYVITLTPAATAYTTGMVITFKANTVNTGACTVNVNGLGAKSLKMNSNLDPVDGYIKAGADVMAVYDGTNFQILSVSGKPSVSQTGEEIYAASAAGSDTYAVTLTPAPVAYVTGMTIRMKTDVANTGAATVNVNGLGAKSIVKNISTALETGDILAGQVVQLVYDGTNFQLNTTTPLSIINAMPVVNQVIPYTVSTVVLQATGAKFITNIDGSLGFLAHNTTGNNSLSIFRLVRDSISGTYYITHTTTLSGATDVSPFGLIATSTYLYVHYDDGGTKKISRYDLADLANVTAMTISGSNWNNGGSGFSDGTNLYIYTSTAVVKKYTISGTTATYDSDITYTSSGDFNSGSACSDGTSVYITESTSGAITIRKYALAGGSASSTTVIYIYPDAFPSTGRIMLHIRKTGVLGIGYAHTVESLSAVTGSVMELTAITQP